MIEDLLGDAVWPLALILVAIIAGITLFSIVNAATTADTRTSCIRAHGTLGEHNGWPTCTGITK